LGDVAMLVRNSGRSFLQRAGNANLKYQFGIAPLVGDLVKLLNFQDQLERRIKELEKLASPRGLRRTVLIGEYSATSSKTLSCQSNQASILNRPFSGKSTLIMKAHVRWKPEVELLSIMKSSESMRALARRAVLGLTLDASTAWELIPWSWLIDWGTNVGTYFKANRNIVPAQLHGVHIMRHTKTTWTTPNYVSGLLTMSGIKATRTAKTRNPSSVALTAHFPFLTGRQVGIVASLAVTRR
jgi:hypothetical protein